MNTATADPVPLPGPESPQQPLDRRERDIRCTAAAEVPILAITTSDPL